MRCVLLPVVAPVVTAAVAAFLLSNEVMRFRGDALKSGPANSAAARLYLLAGLLWFLTTWFTPTPERRPMQSRPPQNELQFPQSHPQPAPPAPRASNELVAIALICAIVLMIVITFNILLGDYFFVVVAHALSQRQTG